MQVSVKEALLAVIVDTVLLVGLTSSLLYFTNYWGRITQTLTALAGTSSLLGIFTFPVLLMFVQLESSGNNADFLLLLLLGLTIWNFIVYAHILSQTLVVPISVGFMLTFIMYLLSLSVLNQLVLTN
jgi:hypothetical protein